MSITTLIAQAQSDIDALTISNTPAEIQKVTLESVELPIDDTNLLAVIYAKMAAITSQTSMSEKIALKTSLIALLNVNNSIEIGEIITTPRTALDDGRALLPLSTQARILTAVELLAYPKLAATLPDLPAYTKAPNARTIGLGLSGTNAFERAVLADGSAFYYDSNDDLYRYTRADDEKTIVYGGANTDRITSISCSADGQVVAIVVFDASETRMQLRVSTNGGVTFPLSVQTDTGVESTDRGSVYVNAAGTMVAAVFAGGASSLRHIRIDAPLSGITPDVDLLISNNLSQINILGPSTASFSEDGTTFVVTYANNSNFDEIVTEYTEDSGATFTRINAYPLDGEIPLASIGDWRVVLDSNNPERLLLAIGDTSDTGGVWYSPDKGVTWVNIPSPDNTFLSSSNDNGGGWAPSSTDRPQFKNGIAKLRTAAGFSYIVHIAPDGTPTYIDKIMSPLGGASTLMSIGWAADNQSFAVGGSVGGSEYPVTGVMTIGKQLPAALLHSNQKIVGDSA